MWTDGRNNVIATTCIGSGIGIGETDIFTNVEIH